MNFQRIDPDKLNGRQKEIYNFQKSAALLADYGFNCIKLTDDWKGADFLAHHFDGNTTLCQGRRILTRAGIVSPRSRRSPQHRFRRQRMPQAGMLVQLDGSHHAWLEDRGPKFALLLAVDDATGTVVNAIFRTGEDTRGYFMLLDGVVQRWGLP